ncbi:GGDEF domain-containing protein [Azospirillum soli]|uniref:GGDEF domain-containing protein n=1 Tax=Azospirillum soli TaxID=1304799 RepID=UPI001AE66FFE|nr:GGDEF domain-containing protein [Azospirillum soli]MBP2314055.1 diguanylate cyclase (GGDEF)-like protein [Azospirillum soli]
MNAIVTALEPKSHAAAERFDGLAWTPAVRGVRLGTPRAIEPDALAQQLADAKAMIAEQQERIAYLESLTMTDELTGLLNRRGFYSHFRRELASARRNGTAGGVLVMIDLDGFKAINDTHGHLAGDSYLRQVARLIVGAVRQEDVVARLGGDEFAVLLTNTDAETGAARARQLAEQAHGQHAEWGGAELPIRFSIGIQAYGSEDHEDDVIRQADVKMYGDKGERRRKAKRRTKGGRTKSERRRTRRAA